MIEIGKYNTLTVISKTPAGISLGDGSEEVLLSSRDAAGKLKIGEQLKFFVYLNNENRPVATIQKPFATVGEFAFLTVREINEHGAFFYWGIDKDVFASYSEQLGELQTGNKYLVYIFIDERSGRIAATLKWRQFINGKISSLRNGDKVQILIAQQTDAGFKAIINNQYEGLLYKNEIFQPLQPGDIKQGFIKQIRDDGKIDLTLQQQGYAHVEETKNILLQQLITNKGFLPLGDKSSPEEIYRQLKISKKAFKKTIGALFKEKLINIADFEIRLVEERK